jgi:hypothetical protein
MPSDAENCMFLLQIYRKRSNIFVSVFCQFPVHRRKYFKDTAIDQRPSSSVDTNRRFGGKYCRHFQCRRVYRFAYSLLHFSTYRNAGKPSDYMASHTWDNAVRTWNVRCTRVSSRSVLSHFLNRGILFNWRYDWPTATRIKFDSILSTILNTRTTG